MRTGCGALGASGNMERMGEASARATHGRVELEREGHLAMLVLDHPERRNAISVSMWRDLEKGCGVIAADPAVRCVIVRGAGEAAFVSGADISEFGSARSSAEAEREYGSISGRAVGALLRLEQPVVALIHGYCIGGGLALALACDLRWAADDAVFSIPAARLGVGYSLAGVRGLVQVIGPARAKQMLFTAGRFRAEEALEMGLVDRVVPKAQLDLAVQALAEAIAGNAPLTLRAVKLAVNAALRDAPERDTAAVQDAVDACFDSEDYREGVRAFLEKRRPRFQGR